MTSNAPKCPICKVRECSYDNEPGSGPSYFSTCSRCCGLTHQVQCNKPECLTDRHTSIPSVVVGWKDEAHTDPIFECTRCHFTGDFAAWGRRIAWFSAKSTFEKCEAWLGKVRYEQQVKDAANAEARKDHEIASYRTHPMTAAYATGYVEYWDYLVAGAA